MKILKRKQIIVALDFNSIKEANSIVKLLDPEIYRLKIGKQLFAAEGPKSIEKFNKQGFDIFLDLKLHDIPNTVYKALKNLLNYKVWMTNIHLLGGEEMIQAAKEARESIKSETLLIGVSVLTSLSEKNIKNMGFDMQIPELVKTLSMSAKRNNIDGIVCSAKEAFIVRKKFKNLLIITPGIRLPGDSANDQKRIMTPKNAFENKVSGIVIGRSLTEGNIKKNIKRLLDHLSK